MRKMRGTTLVEFTLVASVLMVILFACFEFGRGMFILASLNEGTRRAARLAAVCPINDPAVSAAVNFLSAPNFTSANVSVNYLDGNGAVLANPSISTVDFVSVGIVGYTIPLAIPFVSPVLTVPSFTVTLPAESLGFANTGVSTAC